MGIPSPGFEVFASILRGGGIFCEFWVGCAAKTLRILFVLLCCVYLAMIHIFRTSTSEIIHETDSSPHERNSTYFASFQAYEACSVFEVLVFLGEYFDFQTACLSQFEEETNVY